MDAEKALSPIRRRALELNGKIGLSEVALSLPMHISLKISFPVPDDIAERVVETVASFLEKQTVTEVTAEALECCGNVLWIRIAPSGTLWCLHRTLDQLLKEQYGVEPHLLDRSFVFHATLFMDEKTDRLETMRQALSPEYAPTSFAAREGLIGISTSGQAGTYRVIRRIPFLAQDVCGNSGIDVHTDSENKP